MTESIVFGSKKVTYAGSIIDLKEVKWWDNDVEWFNCHWALMNDMEKLKEYYSRSS